jgi:hypothetical protein
MVRELQTAMLGHLPCGLKFTMEPTLGFPALSVMPGQFLLKDIVLFSAAVWSLGESLEAIVA